MEVAPERLVRRAIANSNEKRRMESINAGYESLKELLPNHHSNTKLSKSRVLKEAADHIFQLQQDKITLLIENSQLKRTLSSQINDGGRSSELSGLGPEEAEGSHLSIQDSPRPDISNNQSVMKKRKYPEDQQDAQETIGEVIGELIELKRETINLRIQLEIERRHRLDVEEQLTQQQYGQQLVQQNEVIDNNLQYEPDSMDMEVVEEVVEISSSTATIENAVPADQIVLDETPRCYTLRNNLESIVEAIRHLEGDRLFSKDCIALSPILPQPSAGTIEVPSISRTSICRSLESECSPIPTQSLNEVHRPTVIRLHVKGTTPQSSNFTALTQYTNHRL